MGNWTLRGIAGNTSPLNSGDTFGHNVMVRFQLHYKKAPFSKFEEVPLLEWNEQIFMIEHHKNEWWEFEANMYQHNPLSKTLEIWAKRYLVAYDAASGRPSISKGSSELLTERGQPLPRNALGKAKNDAGKADAVRHYLKQHGGMLNIQVHDIPSINRPDQNTRKERLLVFDCGIKGGGQRFKGAQYLDLDGAQPQGSWRRDFAVGNAGTYSQEFTSASKDKSKVAPPAIVSQPRQALFAQGECW